MIKTYQGQFLFKKLLGVYLLVHFTYFYLYKRFFVQNHYFDIETIHHYLFSSNSEPFIDYSTFLLIMIFSSIIYLFGYSQKIALCLLLYGWLRILFSFPYIAPHEPYISWLIVGTILLPLPSNESINKLNINTLYFGAVFVLGISYFLSGIDKLIDSNWFSGNAIGTIFSSPIARIPIYSFEKPFISLFFNQLLKVSSYLFLFIELFFLPFFLFQGTRKYMWILSISSHVSALIFLQIPSVSFGMILFHLFIFDDIWLKRVKSD